MNDSDLLERDHPWSPELALSADSLDVLRHSPWQWWRDQMPITDSWVYFDHAAVGPLSKPAADAMRRHADEAEKLGDTVWPTWNKRLEQLRSSAAALVGTTEEEITLIPNTSTGINLVAEGFPWEVGDNVVVPEGEFPSNLFPWQNQESRGVELRQAPRREQEVLVEDLMDLVDSRTRIISVSWVGYASGYRVDLATLVERAHERGVLVFVDAIQGMGMFPLDLGRTDVDFLAADGHKWMLGPEGLGFAMIRKRHLEKLRCTNVGWNSVRNTFNYAEPSFDLRTGAARFEPGSPNMVSSAALGASLSLFLQVRAIHGESAIAERVLDLVAALSGRLTSAGFPHRLPRKREQRSGILTFEVPGHEPSKVREHLLENGIVCSCRGVGIRVSLHAYNHEGDLDKLMDALAQYQ
ncbi:MAG: aminotransferase class V-fold PLP-dependent enzyme [Planctomycetota bacterium]